MQNYIKKIRIGDWVAALIYVVTFGFGEHISLWIARKFFRSNNCYCCERKEWLNRLTNKEYNGYCNEGIKLYDTKNEEPMFGNH